MDRRKFLKAIGATGVFIAIDPREIISPKDSLEANNRKLSYTDRPEPQENPIFARLPKDLPKFKSLGGLYLDDRQVFIMNNWSVQCKRDILQEYSEDSQGYIKYDPGEKFWQILASGFFVNDIPARSYIGERLGFDLINYYEPGMPQYYGECYFSEITYDSIIFNGDHFDIKLNVLGKLGMSLKPGFDITKINTKLKRR